MQVRSILRAVVSTAGLSFEPGEFALLRKMLLGSKQRAERLAAEQDTQAEAASASGPEVAQIRPL